MWICFHCMLKLVKGDKKELKKYFMSAISNGTCDKCKKENTTVDWLGEVDKNILEKK